MHFKNFRIPIMIIILTSGILLGTQIQKAITGDDLIQNLRKFNDVMTFTTKFYVEEVDSEKLVESAINGMLEDLDPHSTYIPAKDMQQVEEEFRGDFEGIGIEFQVVNDTLTVVSPITGGPSEALGILAGDRIIEIDNEDAIGITNDEVRKKLRGQAGTKVTVTIVRPGDDEEIEYEIIRDKIPLYSVDTKVMMDNSTGYISISRFAEKTTGELIQALSELKSRGMQKLILDLRNNPGGYLNQAFQIADLFIEGEKKIVYTRGRRTEFEDDFYASAPSPFEKIPLIILVNRGSASASEIVSGAIQDWDRGLIVGETTFGKGLVQRPFTLSDGSQLRLTVSEYFTPSGRLIQRKYDNKEDYYRDVMEREEVEGDNLEHEAEGDSLRPTYKTANGRTVYGGGGITPDYIVKNDKLTGYSVSLLRKNVFYRFILGYLDTHGPEIEAEYGDNMDAFVKGFEIDEVVLKDFIAYSEDEGVEFVEEDYQKDKDYIQARLKAQIARNYWKNDGWYSVLVPLDEQVEKATTLFDKAKEIAGL